MKKASGKYLILFCSMTVLLLASCTDSVAPVYEGANIRVIETTDLDSLKHQFDRFRYSLDRLDNGVPPIILQTFPSELNELHSISEKKQIFFQTLLPMILLANEEIRQERRALQELKEVADAGEGFGDAQLHLLETLARRYAIGIDSLTSPEVIGELLLRIDIVPPELALAQAANESAWGTSRFSRLANNLFGEWTFTPGTGIVPEGRPEGATYEVRRFATLFESIRSYLRNLNTHYAYSEFRQLRQQARLDGQPLSGLELANGLHRYSTRREAYVKDLQALIRQNRLNRYAKASLRQT